jgi:hypothetical protein
MQQRAEVRPEIANKACTGRGPKTTKSCGLSTNTPDEDERGTAEMGKLIVRSYNILVT